MSQFQDALAAATAAGIDVNALAGVTDAHTAEITAHETQIAELAQNAADAIAARTAAESAREVDAAEVQRLRGLNSVLQSQIQLPPPNSETVVDQNEDDEVDSFETLSAKYGIQF